MTISNAAKERRREERRGTDDTPRAPRPDGFVSAATASHHTRGTSLSPLARQAVQVMLAAGEVPDAPTLAAMSDYQLRALFVAQQHLEYALGRIHFRIVVRDASLADPFPAILARSVVSDVVPRHLQPCGGHPLFSPLKCIIDEPHQDSRRSLRPQPQDLHFNQLVDLAGSIGPRLSRLHLPILDDLGPPWT